MVDETQQWDLSEELNRLSTSYSYMLQYLSQGILDPQRDNILSQILVDTYELSDKTVILLAADQSTHIFYQRNKQYKSQSLNSLAAEYLVELNKLQIINSVENESLDNEASKALLRHCETLESDIFNKVWSTFPTTAADIETISSILASDKHPSHLKSLVLSALMLGLSKFFDQAKLKILLQSYASLEDNELKLRALINAVIVIYLYRSRIGAYKDASSKRESCLSCRK